VRGDKHRRLTPLTPLSAWYAIFQPRFRVARTAYTQASAQQEDGKLGAPRSYSPDREADNERRIAGHHFRRRASRDGSSVAMAACRSHPERSLRQRELNKIHAACGITAV